MTVKEVIEKVDGLRRNNNFTIKDKMRWINQCEAKVQLKCLLLPCVEIVYDYDKDADEELIAKPPHDELYIYYICAKIDEALGEMERYNDTITQYNDTQADFQKWLIRMYDPKKNKLSVKRSAPVITCGDEVEIIVYKLPAKAGDITEAKALLTQGETTKEITDVNLENNTLTFVLTSDDTYALKEGSLYVGYDIVVNGKQYRNEKAERLYVEAFHKTYAEARSVDKWK